MKAAMCFALGLFVLSACTPARVAGGAAVGAGKVAVGAGKVVVGAADVVF
ncbi:MAG: hypothetical protein AAFY14_09265 [Pseudomonadota bacterium]